MPLRSFELREFFHLVFLRHLSLRLSGRAYAVKGGICLRFFHRSARLSQDVDLDIVSKVRMATLKKGVNSILESRAFVASLTSQGVGRISFRQPKQTETTQRWKVSLYLEGGDSLPTKIAFSRRNEKVAYTTGIPDAELLGRYKMPPFAVQFYDAISMSAQKISALASSSRYAVRDLFDLRHLLRTLLVKPDHLRDRVKQSELEQAAKKASRFTHQDFKEQVSPYLSGNLMDIYRDPRMFEKLKAEVEEDLLGIVR
ncbi:MAG: nucleotidyl transferase AbiEii/AbiGii toxin family protein [Elusimicrobia bacterium]|nr:nucleotidyl transferase AbiEii/AbiGii toxin family protein [Elusimicrobiota bacterium]